jgi:hypothetical protein
LIPNRFDWVEIGCVGWQPFDGQPVGPLLLQLPHCRSMHVQPVADQDDRSAGHAPQFQHEGQEVWRFHVMIEHGEVQRQPA